MARRAFQAIRTRGVLRTRMKDLADDLGMKRPTLYWHFKDLGEIFDAALEDHFALIERYVSERLVGLTHPLDMLEMFVQAHFDLSTEQREVLVLLFQLWGINQSSQPDRVIERIRRWIEPTRLTFIDLLTQGAAIGLVKPCDAETVVDFVFAVLDGALMHRVARDIDLERIMSMLREQVLEPLRI